MGDKEITKFDEKQKKIKILKSNIENEDDKTTNVDNLDSNIEKEIDILLENNKKWVSERIKENHLYFKRLAYEEKPTFLWIGCSDSRVPPEKIVKLPPGKLYVHRNIANVIIYSDSNALSVIHYAVSVLKIRNIIICGHYNCGGVKAAMSNGSFGTLDKWLRTVKDVYQHNHEEVSNITDYDLKVNRMVELNVMEQVKNVAKSSIIQSEWKTNSSPFIHGWVYDISTGLVKTLITIEPNQFILDDIYTFKF